MSNPTEDLDPRGPDDDADDVVVKSDVATEPDPPADPGPPPPITPDTPTDEAQRRIGLERLVNAQVEEFVAQVRVDAVEHFLAGRTLRLVAVNADGTDYDADDDDDDADIAPETALAAAADAGLVPYSEWSKDDLADECRNRDLPVSGTKDELIARLEADDAEDAAALEE